MGTEAERQDTRKAMAYDILKLLKKAGKETVTLDELDTFIEEYLNTANQK